MQADLSNMKSVAEYKKLVDDELASLDIGILHLNAGCMPPGTVDLLTDADFERLCGLNVLHVVYLFKAILPKLLARQKRCLVLSTSSSLANGALPGQALYCGTKALVSLFMEAVHYELRDRIDVTAWEPGMCYTNLFEGQDFTPPGCLAQKADVAVGNILKQAGDRRTNGSLKFDLQRRNAPPIWLIGGPAA